MKIIISGSFDISDETGKKVHAVAGDVFYFPKGSKITFETTDGGLAFFVSILHYDQNRWRANQQKQTGQRKEGGA
jgi:ethanolamine utilization protein EutQ (cupin superfamily)